MSETSVDCISEINRMLSRSTTKVIFPIITFGLIKEYVDNGHEYFFDSEIKNCYQQSVQYFKDYLGHSLHIGGKYYDAYPSRNLPKYGVLKVIDNKRYFLTSEYKNAASELLDTIPNLVKQYITDKLGNIPSLGYMNNQVELAKDKIAFTDLLHKQMNINPMNFEIFSFAVLKTHLEKFACKLL